MKCQCVVDLWGHDATMFLFKEGKSSLFIAHFNNEAIQWALHETLSKGIITGHLEVSKKEENTCPLHRNLPKLDSKTL